MCRDTVYGSIGLLITKLLKGLVDEMKSMRHGPAKAWLIDVAYRRCGSSEMVSDFCCGSTSSKNGGTGLQFQEVHATKFGHH